MGRERLPYDGHNRKPQKTPMRTIRQRRSRRRTRQRIRDGRRPWEVNE